MRPTHGLLLALVLALAGCLSSPPTASADLLPSTLGGPLVATGAWALPGNATLLAGGLLTLDGVDAAPADGQATLRVAAGATLRLLQARVAGPLDIRVEAGGTLVAAGARLDGVRIELAGGTATFTGTDLVGRVTLRNGTLHASGGTWTGPDASIVSVAGGNATLDGTRLTGGAQVGLQAERATLVVRAATFAGNGGYGLWAQDSVVTVLDANFTRNADYGLLAVRSTVTLEGSRFDNHCGAFLDDASRGRVAGNAFATPGHGLTLRSTGLVAVEDNAFTGAAPGVTLMGAAATLTGNTFEGNRQAVLLLQANATLLHNAFHGNHVGVDVPEAASHAWLRNNSFAASGEASIRSPLSVVDARWNWWSAAGGPGGVGAERVVGRVDSSPWLDAPPG